MSVRIIQTTDAGLTKTILENIGDCLVLYYDASSHVGRDQMNELAKFLAFQNRKAMAVNVPRQAADNPDRPVRLTRLPTLALFRNGQCIRRVDGLVRFGQIGKQLF
ncbi:MAG: hypothetical protein WC654_08480 [Patescibacteria group bacterium]